MAPTHPEQEHFVVAFTQLSPYEGGEIFGQAAIAFERESANTFRQWILQQGFDLDDLDVNWNSIAQILLDGGIQDGGADSTQGQREMQESAPPSIIIESDVSVIFRSPTTDYDVQSWVYEAWQDEALSSAFLTNLQRRSAVFQGVEEVNVEVEGYIPPPPNGGVGPEPSPDKDTSVAVIAGATVGGAALVLLAVFLYVRLSSDGSVNEGHHQSQTTPSTTGQQPVAVST